MNFKYIIGGLIYVSISYAQSEIFQTNPGYIVVESDTSSVPIYVYIYPKLQHTRF